MTLMQSESLEGVVERITFYNDENGYTVLRLRPNKPRFGQVGRDGLATVVGSLPELQPGESVRFAGGWVSSTDYGKQFKAEKVEQMAPATVEGLRRYLGSGMIKGVGPTLAARIVGYFGMKTLDILEVNPQRMIEVPGIGKAKVKAILQGWDEQREIKAIMLFLQSHNVSAGLATKIFKEYKDKAIEQVQNDPYRLARDIHGIGFRTADRIARDLGLPPDSPARIAAGVIFALNEMTNQGDVYGPRPAVVEEAARLLDVPAELCETAIERLFSNGELMLDVIPVETGPAPTEAPEPPVPPATIEALYVPPMYYSEKGAARRLLDMVESASSRLRSARTIDWEKFFVRLAQEDNANLTAQQQDAVRAALTHKVSILTGGPGTGKTTTLRAVIRALESITARYALASPTGRAARRLSEATGRPASTIHKLLGFRPGSPVNDPTPLDVDILIIDETSMLDLILFYNMLKKLTPETHLMLVGDVDQLPSVGAGDVLRDLIRSGVAHTTRLATIFRQASASLIIANAHRINQGHMPDLSNQGDDFFLFAADNAESAIDLVVDVVKNRVPKRFGLNPIDDIQVLAPMYRGAVGIEALNERLQAALNPGGSVAERTIGGRIFRVGDKVMQTRNNYDKDVYNGDIGRIHAIDFNEQQLKLVIYGRFVEYEFAETDELTHAFAVSVHRSQGSEYPAVVMPVVSQHYMMLQRNLLYTAVTRAKKLVVLIGTRWAVEKAVQNNQVARRCSGLAWRLSGNAQ